MGSFEYTCQNKLNTFSHLNPFTEHLTFCSKNTLKFTYSAVAFNNFSGDKHRTPT